MEEDQNQRIRALAEELFQAWQEQKPVEPFSRLNPDLTLADAYEVQREMLALLKQNGYSVSGKKLGYTNPEMQKKMGLSGPSYGVLLRERRFAGGETVPASRFIQPGIETELLFTAGEDLNLGPYTKEELKRAVSEVHIAMEIVDMRQIRQGKTQIDSVGDLGAFGAYVVSPGNVRDRWPDFGMLEARLLKNGEPVAQGTGLAVMEDPWNALLWLVNELWNTEDFLKKGEEVMTGSFTPLIAAAKGDRFEATFGGTEKLSVVFG